ncbi:MAG TPA: class III extradiol ring-cleavage dioxygenase [Sphingopyxis sp.]|nr:class III extradiol ring-cleavage dioxygenase [Sphingopyxis sp.]
MRQIMRLPSLFISHGSPMMALEPSAARDYLSTLGADLLRPSAILVVSAHHDADWTGGRASITASPAPPTVHDFSNFPQALFDMRYPASGDPELALHVQSLLAAHGLDIDADPERGLDHGAWVPLSLIYPDADIPVVQLSIHSSAPPEWHYALGQALAPLREDGVLIIGSGSMTHNLRAIFGANLGIDAPAPHWVSEFTEWAAQKVAEDAVDDLLHIVERAPYGHENHPTMDHILPLHVAMGAGSMGGALHGKRLHHSTTYGMLAMDVYAFGMTD